MADIFISYAREDREAVEKLAGLIEAAGLSCWWDRQLAAGARYREKTEIELNAAKAVLVVWTKHSVGSHWVADEATAAVEAGKLAPISLDGALPPLGFRQFQVIDFTGWKGAADGPVKELLAALAAFAPQVEIKVAANERPSPPATAQQIRWPLVVAALVAVVASVGLFLFLRPEELITPASQRVAFFGFTAADHNPDSAKIAGDATDQTFAEFTRFRLEAAAKADSLAPYTTDRLTRADALDSAYALSGEVRIEGEMARLTIRLEDVVTRVTLWEIAETSPVARQFYSPPKQAAFRAGASTGCVVRQRAELSSENPKALQAIAGYCANLFSPAGATDMERGVRAFRLLADLEPRSVYFKTALASQLVFTGGFLPTDLRAERFRYADALLTEALQMAPGDAFSVAIAEFLHSARGGSRLEAEKLLATGRPGGLEWGDGYLSTRRGLNMLGNGRTEKAVALLSAGAAAQPSFSQVLASLASGLAGQGKAADAEVLFEEVFAKEPGATGNWYIWARTVVLEDIGDAEAVLAAAPENESRANVACWQSVLAAKRAGKPGPSPDSLRDCGPVVSILAALGRVDEAFGYYRTTGQGLDPRMLFAPSARAMRAHKDFLPLVKELGLWEYWIATKSQPDVCELKDERDFAVCRELRAARLK